MKEKRTMKTIKTKRLKYIFKYGILTQGVFGSTLGLYIFYLLGGEVNTMFVIIWTISQFIAGYFLGVCIWNRYRKKEK
jgi:hypothetical protein